MAMADPQAYDTMDIAALTALANSKLEGVKTVYEAYEERLEDDETALRQWRDSMAVALDKYYSIQPTVVGKKAGVKRILLEMAKNAKDLFNDVDASLERKRLERERLEEERKIEQLRMAERKRKEEELLQQRIVAAEKERSLRTGETSGEGVQVEDVGEDAVGNLPPSSRRRIRKRHHSELSEDIPSSTPTPRLHTGSNFPSVQSTGSFSLGFYIIEDMKRLSSYDLVSTYETDVLALLPEDHRLKMITEGEKIGRWAIPNYVPEGDELSNPNSPLYKCDHKGKTHDGAKGRKEKWKGDQRCTQCRVHNVSPCLSTGCHACASCTQKKQGPCSHTYGARKSLETQLADKRAKEEKERAKADVVKSAPDNTVDPQKRNPKPVPGPALNGRPTIPIESDEEENKSGGETEGDLTKSAGASMRSKKRPRPMGRMERLEDELDEVNKRIAQAEEAQQQAFERIHNATLEAQKATTTMQLGYRDKQRIEHDLERERERTGREP